METIFTISTVIVGLMSTTTMGNASNESIRTMSFSLATASGISWLSKEMQRVFQAAGKEAYPSVSQVAITICIILETYLLYRFLMQSKRQRGKLAKRDVIASVLLLIGVVSWVIVYQQRLFSFNHFFPELVLIPILLLLAAMLILSSHVLEENDAPKKSA